jgi:hypothetical protein
MSDLVEYRTAIATFFLTNFTALPADRIEMPNEKFVPPDPTAGLLWGRFMILEFTGRHYSLGDVGMQRKFERTGSVIFQVRAPTDEGSKDADAIANTARDVLEGQSISGSTVWLQGATVRHIGVDGAWYLVTTEVEFLCTETK